MYKVKLMVFQENQTHLGTTISFSENMALPSRFKLSDLMIARIEFFILILSVFMFTGGLSGIYLKLFKMAPLPRSTLSTSR